MLTKYWRLLSHLFLTTPSKIPSIPKEPENCWLSTGPGSWNEIEKCPGGHRFCDCIWKIWEFLHTIFFTSCCYTLYYYLSIRFNLTTEILCSQKWWPDLITTERWILEAGSRNEITRSWFSKHTNSNVQNK